MKRFYLILLYQVLFSCLNSAQFVLSHKCRSLHGSPFFPDGQSLLFSKTPKDTTFLNTKTTVIECKAQGRPKASISWENIDGERVGNISGLRQVLSDGSLVFPAFAQKDFSSKIHVQRYRCVAENDIGKLRSAAIKVKAVIDNPYSPRVFHQRSFTGGSAVFKCDFDADSHISLVSWNLKWHFTNAESTLKDGESKGRLRVLKSLPYLIISSLRNDDNYLKVKCYTKDALNGVTLESSQAYLYMQKKPPKNINLALPPLSQTTRKGADVILPCIANAHPSFDYFWYKDGSRLVPSSRLLKSVGGSMILKNVGQNDKGEYKCVVRSGNETKSAIMHLIVIESVRFTRTLQSQSISLGKSLQFSCKVTGLPTPSITWLKDGIPISTGSHIVITRALQANNVLSSELVLYLVSHRDEGIYQCVAKNIFEEKQTSSRLVVGAIKPRITTAPQDRPLLDQDGALSLKCIAAGQPTPKLTWWSDGVEIKRWLRFTVSTTNTASGGIQSILMIEGLRMSDSALYACKAENKAGVAVKESDVAVKGAPTIIRFPERVSALVNQAVYFHCNAKGHPLATIKWSKDSNWHNLATDDQYTIFENGTLLISSVQRENKGKYKCEASNQAGKDEQSLVLNVQEPPTIAPFKWTPVEAGHRLSKTCQVPTGDLPIRITWYWNGKIITSGNGVQVNNNDFHSFLIFSEVKASHRGRYTCKAENAAGYALHSEDLIVNESPQLIVSPKDVSVLKPNTLQLSCKASGFPAPQIVWYKKAEFIESRELLQLTDRIRQYENGSLLIFQTSAKDNGKYTCSAENGIGKNAERTVTIDVKVPAKVMQGKFQIVRKRKGASAVIQCQATGTPTVQLHWYKSSKPISVSPKYHENKLMKKFGNQIHINSTLKVNNLLRGDSGTYICQVTNSFGGDTKDFHVIVLEKPDPPKKPTSGIIESRWLEVKWMQPFNGHSKIIRYAVEYIRHADIWLKKSLIYVTGNRTKARVHGLSPGTNYNFRVKAFNEIGESETSKDSVFRTNEEAPSAAPLNVTITAIAKDKLKVEWRPPPDESHNGIILGYNVSYKEFYVSEPWKVKVIRGQSLQVFIENLLPYTSYEIRIKAFTKAGVGPASPIKRKITLQGAPTAPPSNIKAVPISSQIISVSWRLPPLSHRHGLIKGYKVRYSKKFSKDVLEKIVTRVHYAELTNLEKYTEYTISVLAFTEGGDGKLSDSILARTLEDVPGPPEQLRAAAASPHQILVTWKKPSKPNGVITGYILHYRKSMDGSTSQHEFRLSKNASSHILHGLEVGKKYEIWMNAQTKIGTGLRTGFVRAMTMTKIPARILTVPQIVKVPVHADVGLPCVAVGHPKPIISWYFNIKRIIKRRRRSTPYYNEGKLVLSNVKLKDAGPYNCSAVNEYGSDWNIITLVVQGFPSRPKTIQAQQFNKSSVNISWVPGFNAHSRIIRHQIKYRFGNRSSWSYLSVVPNKHWTVFEVNVGSRAFFAVASENSVGVGSFSNIIEVYVTVNGLITRVISDEKQTILESASMKEEKENVLGPIIAGCVVSVVIVTIIMLLASWDRTERRMRTPKCNRLFVCGCDDDFPKDQFRGTYDGPYNEPNVPWPWNSTGNSIISSNENQQMSDQTGEEERFPEHLFAQLLNFDENEEVEADASKNHENSSPTKPESTTRLGTSSTNTYKTSDSSKDIYTSNSLLSSRNMPSSVESETGNAEASNALASRSEEEALSGGKFTERAKRSYKDQQLRHYFKSLDSGLQKKPNLKLYLTHSGGTKTASKDAPRENHAKGIKSLTLLVRDNKVKRSRSVRSYDSVSSTCSSTRGELVRAYEFGRKYKLQEYFVPHIGDSTTEDSCSEISELCEFSSLPRNTNDCLLRMPLPIRPTIVDTAFKGLQVKTLQDPYDGESLV